SAATTGGPPQTETPLPPGLTLPSDFPTVPVGLRLFEKTLELSAATPQAEAVAGVLHVPDTDPLWLEVSWQRGTQERVTQVNLSRNQTQRIAVGAGPVRVRVASGAVYELRPAVEYDLLIAYPEEEEAWVDQLAARLESEETKDGRLLRVIFLPLVARATRPPARWQSFDEVLPHSRGVAVVTTDAQSSRMFTAEMVRLLFRAGQSESEEARSLTVLRRGGEIAGALGGRPWIDFRDEATFADGYRELLSQVTGERAARPAAEREALKVYVSYARHDKFWAEELLPSLKEMEREGLIEVGLNDIDFQGIASWESRIEKRIAEADVVVVLISAEYLSSRFARAEMEQAVRRARESVALILPVMLQPCDLASTPLHDFHFVNQRPLAEWPKREEGLREVANGIRRAVEWWSEQRQPRRAEASPTETTPTPSEGVEAATAQSTAGVPAPPAVGYVARRDSEGRDLVETLRNLLSPGKSAVALWGPDGIGKTTIAAATARGMWDERERGIVWIDVAQHQPFTPETLVREGQRGVRLPEEILSTGIHPDMTPEFLVANEAFAPRLYVLDDFDAITPDEQGLCLEWLLSTPSSVLLTSREPHSESVRDSLAVPPMWYEEAQEYIGKLTAEAGSPRALAGMGSEIYKAADGNPLVIEWMVRLIGLTGEPETIFRAFAATRGDARERVAESTYRLPQVGDDGRDAVRAFVFFRQGASVAALTHVAGFGRDTLRLDAVLQRNWLYGLGIHQSDGERLWLKPEFSQFANSLLAEVSQPDPYGRPDPLLRRFIEFFYDFVKEHSQITPADLNALATEHQNLLAALEYANAIRELRWVIELHGRLLPYFEVRGHWDDALHSAELARAAETLIGQGVGNLGAETEGIEDELKLISASPAAILIRRGKYSEAERLLRAALDVYRRRGNLSGEAATLRRLGEAACLSRDFDRAMELLNQSYAIGREQEGPAGAMERLRLLGDVYYYRGEMTRAVSFYADSFGLARNHDNPFEYAHSLYRFARAELGTNPERATKMLEDALEAAKELGDPHAVANCKHYLGVAIAGQGSKDEAAGLLREAADGFAKLGAPEAEESRRELARLRLYMA
ncbi:MAG: TIR domain-containing protein, partial [Pyrinomonadaceae bacterium]